MVLELMEIIMNLNHEKTPEISKIFTKSIIDSIGFVEDVDEEGETYLKSFGYLVASKDTLVKLHSIYS